jgi:hypothetical protein
MTQEEKARKITCRQCQAGAGERCLDQRKGMRGLRIKTIHQIRVSDMKAKQK